MEPEVRKSSKRILRSQTETNSERSKVGKRRKIRAIQDFDNLNRSSLLLVHHENSTEKSRTKKQKNFDFLPRIGLGIVDTKEDNPVSDSTKKIVTPKHKLKLSNDLVNTHKQLVKSKIETFSDNVSSVSSPQDDDSEFKSRLRNKQFNSHNMNKKSSQSSTQNDISQITAKSFQKLEKSLCKNGNNNDSTLEKRIIHNKLVKKSFIKNNTK